MAIAGDQTDGDGDVEEGWGNVLDYMSVHRISKGCSLRRTLHRPQDGGSMDR